MLNSDKELMMVAKAGTVEGLDSSMVDGLELALRLQALLMRKVGYSKGIIWGFIAFCMF